MPDVIFSAGVIVLLRICDVSLGTIRTISVVNSRKYLAGTIGFFEILIWIYAMRFIVQHMDETINLIAYAGGFGIGTVLGVKLEQMIGLGYVQVNMISAGKTDLLAQQLRSANYGVTEISGSGRDGNISVLYTVINKKNYRYLKELVNRIDPAAFINVHSASPAGGFLRATKK